MKVLVSYYTRKEKVVEISDKYSTLIGDEDGSNEADFDPELAGECAVACFEALEDDEATFDNLTVYDCDTERTLYIW